ncbi:hypothetical protein GCM10010522_19870 [Kribbella solani]
MKPSVSIVTIAAFAAGRLSGGIDDRAIIVSAAGPITASGDPSWSFRSPVSVSAWCSTRSTSHRATIAWISSSRSSATSGSVAAGRVSGVAADVTGSEAY